MRYAVDRIENGIVILENLTNNEIKNIQINELKIKIKEGDILFFDGKSYSLDDDGKKIRLKRISEKMARLKNN